MRKVNKILMATVSILLCLVLISTSVVSGIFAKFAINNKGKATASLKAFGVTLDMTVAEQKLKDAGATVVTAEDDESITKSVTITGLKMAPGESIMDAVKINISGTAGVRLKVVIEPKVLYDRSAYENVCGDFQGVPVGLYYTEYDTNLQKVINRFVRTWSLYDARYQAYYCCYERLGDHYGLTTCPYNQNWLEVYGWVEKIFEANSDIVFYSKNDTSKIKPINQFDFHLMWEDRGESYLPYDLAVANANPQPYLQIVLNVRVEQVAADYVSPVPVEK
jgi:hypothetical protein